MHFRNGASPVSMTGTQRSGPFERVGFPGIKLCAFTTSEPTVKEIEHKQNLRAEHNNGKYGNEFIHPLVLVEHFKLREGMPIGAKVTLRGERMWEFLERLVGIAIPRIRDFRGVSGKAFDGRGNYSLGIKEQIVFPEIEYDKVDAVRGLDVTITTTARTDEEGRALLTGFSFPFRN